MSRTKSYYIGWRSNPQLKNGGYYKAFGQLSKTDAKRKEKCAYGSMRLIGYATEAEYQAMLTEHKSNGFTIAV